MRYFEFLKHYQTITIHTVRICVFYCGCLIVNEWCYLKRRLMKFAWNSIIVIDERLQNIYWNLEKTGFTWTWDLTSNSNIDWRTFRLLHYALEQGLRNQIGLGFSSIFSWKNLDHFMLHYFTQFGHMAELH
jgi:hypothetical protein